MTIEIHRPELEAMIMKRMKAGAFQNVEDFLMQALETAHVPETSAFTLKGIQDARWQKDAQARI